MTAAHTSTPAKSVRRTMLTPSATQTVTTSSALFLCLVLSLLVPSSANTIFESLFPTACVTPLLAQAGMCVLNNGCGETCFKTSNDFASDSGTPASLLSLDSEALQDFFIPVDAVECDQFEDPICPAATCCPACRDQLVDLFRCLILESDFEFLDYLARNCPVDCVEGNSGGGFALLPQFGGGTSILAVEEMGGMHGMNMNQTFPSMNETNATIPMMGDDDGFSSETSTTISSTADVATPDWIVPPVVGTPYPPMTVVVGDTLTFAWTSGVHDVHVYPSANADAPCDRTDKITMGDTQSNPTVVTISEDLAGKTLQFTSDIANDCEEGLRLEVTVMETAPVKVPVSSVLLEAIANGAP